MIKIQRMRWVILNLIVLVTVINILDRGTLNYMWQDGKDKISVEVIQPLAFSRALIGLGEAGPWPGTTKSNAEWFPIKERAIAQGFRYNSCSC
jgi:MFS family permease